METTTTAHLDRDESMHIDGPANVLLTKPSNFNPSTVTNETTTSAYKSYMQSNESGGKFVESESSLGDNDKEGFNPSGLNNEDNDLTNKLTGTWETLQTRIKDSGLLDQAATTFNQAKDTLTTKATQLKENSGPMLEQAQMKFKETTDNLTLKAKDLKAMGQKKLADLQKSKESTDKVNFYREPVETDEMSTATELKWGDLLPYLLPLVILTLGLISGIGLYKALFHRSHTSHVLTPVSDAHSEFVDNPMQQTPWHLHDDDFAVRHAKFGPENIQMPEPTMMQNLKFKANLYAHHAKDLAEDSVDSVKDLAGHAAMGVTNSFDYATEKASLLADSLKDKTGLFSDKAKETLFSSKDKEAEEASTYYQKLLKQVEEAKLAAQQKGQDALNLLKDSVKVEEKAKPGMMDQLSNKFGEMKDNLNRKVGLTGEEIKHQYNMKAEAVRHQAAEAKLKHAPNADFKGRVHGAAGDFKDALKAKVHRM